MTSEYKRLSELTHKEFIPIAAQMIDCHKAWVERGNTNGRRVIVHTVDGVRCQLYYFHHEYIDDTTIEYLASIMLNEIDEYSGDMIYKLSMECYYYPDTIDTVDAVSEKTVLHCNVWTHPDPEVKLTYKANKL